MSTLVLTRLLARPLTLWNLFVLGSLGLLLAQGAWLVRGSLATAGGPTSSSEGLVVALLVAASVLGALASWTSFEILSCPFSAGVPRLGARLRDESVGLCVLAGLLTGGVAYAVAGPGAGAATGAMSMLAFGLCFFGFDPRSRPRRGQGWIYVALFMALAVVTPEVPRWGQLGLAATMLGAITLAPVLVLVPFTRERVRARALTDAAHLDPAYREIDVRSGSWGLHLHAPRDGAMRPAGTLRTDWDWARATLHEARGWQRGGWIGAALAGGLFFGSISVVLAVSFSGEGDWITRLAGALVAVPSTVREGLDVGLAFFLTIWFTMGTLNTPFQPVISAQRPVSRARRARIAWLTSSIDDVLVVFAIGGAAALFATLARALRPDVAVAPGLSTWVPHVLVLLLAAPPARWARLKYLDVARGQPGPVRQGVVSGITIVVLAVGCSGLATVWSRAGGVPVVAQVLALLGVLALVHWVWFRALVRHHTRADLAA